ncbi:hypothetical protein DICVIV_07254 [Dictyocaulus viviparus]|uniref:Uncharacterized protein n=1 Tax=Dictyocaulus viviparus TaxID=29172 RepID=A0A0D8XQ98_DICVI|nr:hypothetical protein DICVIV_07254 [Dictyocaulus viviparus]
MELLNSKVGTSWLKGILLRNVVLKHERDAHIPARSLFFTELYAEFHAQQFVLRGRSYLRASETGATHSNDIKQVAFDPIVASRKKKTRETNALTTDQTICRVSHKSAGYPPLLWERIS